MTTKPFLAGWRDGLSSDRFSGLLLALALYIFWANREYPVGTLQEPGPGYLPLLLASFIGAMGLLIALFGGRSTPLAVLRWIESTRAIVILVACGVGTLGPERIGYRLTIIILLIFFLGVLERRRLRHFPAPPDRRRHAGHRAADVPDGAQAALLQGQGLAQGRRPRGTAGLMEHAGPHRVGTGPHIRDTIRALTVTYDTNAISRSWFESPS
jgi:hypothetical protein